MSNIPKTITGRFRHGSPRVGLEDSEVWFDIDMHSYTITTLITTASWIRSPDHPNDYDHSREDQTEASANEMGRIVAKLPMPPGCMTTLYGADQRFLYHHHSNHNHNNRHNHHHLDQICVQPLWSWWPEVILTNFTKSHDWHRYWSNPTLITAS